VARHPSFIRGDINQQHRHHGSVTRSGSQISRLAPLVWDDEVNRSLVIPAKRAGGPRELERVYNLSLKHSERSDWSEASQIRRDDATASHVACSLWFKVLPIRSTVITGR